MTKSKTKSKKQDLTPKNVTIIATILVVIFTTSMSLNAQWARTYGGDKDDVAHSIQPASKAKRIRQLFQEKSGLSPSRQQISEASAGEIYEAGADYFLDKSTEFEKIQYPFYFISLISNKSWRKK